MEDLAFFFKLMKMGKVKEINKRMIRTTVSNSKMKKHKNFSFGIISFHLFTISNTILNN